MGDKNRAIFFLFYLEEVEEQDEEREVYLRAGEVIGWGGGGS